MQKYKNYIKNDINDKEVVDGVISGDKEMYELIMRKYNQRLFRIGRAIIKDDDEIEDILQDVYIKAYENLKNFQWRSGFSTWLTRILINEALACKKRKDKLSYRPEGDGEDSELPNNVLKYIPSNNMNPEEEAINDELRDLLEKVIDSLPEKYRIVYVMREIEGMNIAETADCLEISESNVKVRLNRAKEMLRDSLTNVYKDSEVFPFLGSRCDRIVSRVMSRI